MDTQTYDYTIFRERFYTLLKRNDMTMSSFCEATNNTKASISRYISGKRDPQVPYVISIANYFHVSVDWLLGLTDSEDSPALISDKFMHAYYAATDDDREIVNHILKKYL